MRRLFKYSWRLLLLLILLFLITYFTVLHTQFGARWIINYFIQETEVEIENIEGTLSGQLKLSGIIYKDKSLLINAKQLSYQIKQIHWFNKKLEIESVAVQNLELNLLDNPTEVEQSSGFAGLSLPIEVELNSLDIDQLLIKSNQKTEIVKPIKLALNAKNQNINVTELSIGHQNFLFKGDGSLQLTSNLPYDFKVNWSAFAEETLITGYGNVKGDVSLIDLNQNLNLSKGQVIGEIQLFANIDLNQTEPNLNIKLVSNKLTSVLQDQAPILIEVLSADIIGSINAYEVTSSFQLSNNEFEKSAIELNGLGNLESINLKQLTIKNSQGFINIPSQLNWKTDFTAESRIELTQFNPATYLPEWPGLINGKANLSFLLSDQGYLLSIENIKLDGKLKQEDFSAHGYVQILPDKILVEKSEIVLGKNKLVINASAKDGQIDADVMAVLNDLSILDKELKGILTSNLTIKGHVDNPDINGKAHLENVFYQSYQIKSIDIDANGNWLNNFIVQTNAQNVEIGDKVFQSINFDLKGNRANHNIALLVEDEVMTSEFLAQGSLDEDNYYWNGEILEHELFLKDITSTWKLKDPVKIDYQKDISLSKACWINQDTSGDACLNVALNTSNNNHQINLELNKLNVRFFKIFLPSDLVVDGKLDGSANIQILDGNLNIDSSFKLLDGELQFLKDFESVYQVKILNAELIAKQEEQTSKINSNLQLDDGTSLDFKLDLFSSNNNTIELKGAIEGIFTNTEYLSSLSEEIEEMNGDFNFNGSVEGPINDLVIKFKAIQNQGHLILSQSKTRIENINFNLLKQAKKELEFEVTGLAGTGQFNSFGTLILNSEAGKSPWEISAILKGEKMRLLTLPELELDISPDLKITANNKSTKITGETKIPYALVNIKQLPESAIGSSPDVIIHKSSEINNDVDDYPIIFNISAMIENPIKIDVLGLKSDLKGSIKVTNTENSRINGYGSLKLIDGKYTIYGQTLDISKGEFLFNGAIENPSIDVIASRKSISGDVTAGVELGGTINYLQSSLYSDPSFSDLEILSYILSGRGLNEESNANSQQLAQAAILLGLKKSSPIFSEIQSKLGIDVLTIKEGATSKDSIVEAGKQVNENLYVGYNQGLFSRVGFWVLRYRINQALRLETTQGETQSVDLIYVRKKK